MPVRRRGARCAVLLLCCVRLLEHGVLTRGRTLSPPRAWHDGMCAVERADAALSEACFGLSPAHARLALADSFPMDDVTPEKLFSLFAPLYECNHGTVVYFTSRADASSGAPLVAPTPDGMSVRAGGVALHDFLPRAWMLPRSAAMPVEADYGAAVKRNKLHFVVKLQGPRGMTEVDFGRHPWQRVVAEGYASPAMTLQVPYGGDKVATVHVQFGWLEDDADAGIYLHRHKRFAKMEPHVHRLDSADAGALRQRIASGGPAQQVAAYDVLCRIYGGASPLTKAQLKEHTGSELQRMFGKCQITLVSCHDFAWQEGKEAFMQNALYDRILSAVRVASARYALEHPWPEEYAAKERAARQARGIATRKANAPQRAAAAPADESPASGGSSPTSDDDDDDSSSGEAAGPSTPAGAGAGWRADAPAARARRGVRQEVEGAGPDALRRGHRALRRCGAAEGKEARQRQEAQRAAARRLRRGAAGVPAAAAVRGARHQQALQGAVAAGEARAACFGPRRGGLCGGVHQRPGGRAGGGRVSTRAKKGERRRCREALASPVQSRAQTRGGGDANIDVLFTSSVRSLLR
jgi:hypothetical protein